jgi:hypothetical protein
MSDTNSLLASAFLILSRLPNADSEEGLFGDQIADDLRFNSTDPRFSSCDKKKIEDLLEQLSLAPLELVRPNSYGYRRSKKGEMWLVAHPEFTNLVIAVMDRWEPK